MYLSNTELLKIANSLIGSCDHSEHPFDQNEQVKVCSIDLRLSNVFWISKRAKRSIDLGANFLYEVSPRRLWKKVKIEDGGSIELKRGEMVLGRTYEKLSIPSNLVGKINTRGSYARLGISTACNCDLVNPGYSGHVPLELTNSTKNTIVLRPYLPLCQLFLMPFDGGVEDSYSSEKYHSKYMDDDGGPSVWWRDALTRKISGKVLQSQMDSNVISILEDNFNGVDDDCLYRLEKFTNGKTFSNSTELLEKFSVSEKLQSSWYKVKRGLSLALFPSLALYCFSILWGMLETQQFVITKTNVVAFAATLGSAPFFFHYFFSDQVKFYLRD